MEWENGINFQAIEIQVLEPVQLALFVNWGNKGLLLFKKI